MQSNPSARRRRLAKRRHLAKVKSAMPGLLISPPQQQPKSLADFAWDYYCKTWRKEDPQSYFAYQLAIKAAPNWPRNQDWLLGAITLAALAKGAFAVFDDN
jgi:hypothetical protein